MSSRTDVVLAVEQRGGQRLRELGLTDPGGSEEDERADRAARIPDSGAGPDHRVGDQLDRLVLADHPLVQDFVEPQQLFPLALLQPRDRYAGPCGHDFGDLVLGDDLAQQPACRPAWTSAAPRPPAVCVPVR